jgi:hypothetical protein
MRTTFAALTILALGACATRDPAIAAYPSKARVEMNQDEQERRVERLREEFNTLTPDG